MIDSFNNLINFLNSSSDEQIKENLDDYLIVDRALDYLVFIDFCTL